MTNLQRIHREEQMAAARLEFALLWPSVRKRRFIPTVKKSVEIEHEVTAWYLFLQMKGLVD